MKPIQKIVQHTLDLAVEIQQIPAPTFEEERRAEFIRARFAAEGLTDIQMDAVGNVYARLPGADSDQTPLVVTAHMDTVFPKETDLTLRRKTGRVYGPGIGDNSLGLAGLFGLVWLLRGRNIRLPGDLWLVADVGEEGLGNLRGIRAVVERFGHRTAGYLAVEGMGLGQIFHCGLAVQRYRITLATPGGHSWIHYGQPSAVHEMAALISRLTALPLPTQPRTTLNVGRVEGGTTVNTIAAQAMLELDLRSENLKTLQEIASQVKKTAASFRRSNVHCSLEEIGRRPVGEISPDHPLVRLAVQILAELGVTPTLSAGSTDANLPLSLGYPAICIGLTTGEGAHTLNEFIYTRPVQIGLEQLYQLAARVWGVMAGRPAERKPIHL
jgi:acetylornithine deacetylase/succinyl-diaminopimelate desuccinylase-like protein